MLRLPSRLPTADRGPRSAGRRLTGPVLVLVVLLAVSPARAQDGGTDRDHTPSEQRVDPKARRESDIDGNSIRATIFNFGQSGRTGGGNPSEIPYEWPKNTDRHYIALTGLFVGAETESENGETIHIVDVPNYRSNPNNENVSWSFEPIPGFASPSSEEIARSDQPDTWPNCWPDKQDIESDPGWCSSWNGYFGKDVFNADQEFYYRMGDDQYDRYLDNTGPVYYPDSTDHSRGGLGLLVDSRIMAWSQILIDDVAFHLHAIQNDGTRDLRKVGVTLWLADLVGGDGDSDDDRPFYDLLEDVAWMTDQDNQGNEAFSGASVGVAAASFLETPGNAVDRIDNDGDGTTSIRSGSRGEPGSPTITADLLQGECPSQEVEGRLSRSCYNGLDDNGNGLIDENRTHIPFGQQAGVGFADFIDNDDDGETDGPVVTQEMVDAAQGDQWNRWPPNPEDGQVHLAGVGSEDIGRVFKDNIDNDNTAGQPMARRAETGSPTVTQAMIEEAADDPYGRYRVPGAEGIVLYQLGPEDEGLPYADGLDNDGDGAVDEGIDEGIDEMIDESRSDGLDNDGDWRAELDDLGLDGAELSNDTGEGDGRPTTGAGTELPGEPNIDKTDISESDQIGITNVQYDEAGGIDYQTVSDQQLFNDFMVPGSFYDPGTTLEGDYDLFVSSGTFPLEAGQTERISFSVQIGADQEAVLRKRDNAVEAYEADYQFAQAPITPTVRAVPGDGKVTLYWDEAAEDSYDTFIADLDLGLNPNDFEGYRIYRSTDPSFLDEKSITDGFGNEQFLKPIAQFDVQDGRTGFHPVDVNGVKFFLGEDTGLKHVYEDTTAINGVQYYYAVAAYDYGALFPPDDGEEGSTPAGSVSGIPPSETPLRIEFLADGTITTGPNVVQATPTERPAGYQEATLQTEPDGFLPRVAGTTTSEIGYEIIDPTVIEDGHTYRITFQDTLRPGGRNQPDTITTHSFTLQDVTDDEVVLRDSKTYRPERTAPVTEGFRLHFRPDPFVVLDRPASGWQEDSTNYPIALAPFRQPPFVKGFRNPADYRVEVVGPGEGQSTELQVGSTTLPARPTNVRVTNTITGEEVDYAFADRTGDDGGITATTPARFNADPEAQNESDYLILIEELPSGERGVTWRISLDFTAADGQNPDQGDAAQIVTKKPFLERDVFEFTARAPEIDEEKAEGELDDVVVVPNPYRATSIYENRSAFRYGRERRIQFKNLPRQCTIRIFTNSGHLVRTIRHDASVLDGTEEWDLKSKDGLDVSYGLYLYHIEAPGIGEKTGTFAIIK